MSSNGAVLFLLLWTVAEGTDSEVSCVLLESCVLPCSFDPGPDLLIHWYKEPGVQTPVHSYYHSKNQLQHQHQNFTGRTSLFEKEFSTGNSSLLLSEVRVQDEGTYKCYTSTTSTTRGKESYVKVKVHAPVLQVALQQEAEQLLCRSEGVFPKPSVSWTPSSAAETTFKSSESGVWSVLSSVSLPHSPPHEYSCNVSTPHSWRSATYRRNTLINSSGSDVTIPCSDSPPGKVKSLVWTFNQTETILTQTGSEPVHTESWRELRVTLSRNRSLILKGLSREHSGLFSCELQTDTETFHIHTELEINGAERTEPENSSVRLIVGCTRGALVLAGIVALIVFWKKYKAKQAQANPQSSSASGYRYVSAGGGQMTELRNCDNNNHTGNNEETDRRRDEEGESNTHDSSSTPLLNPQENEDVNKTREEDVSGVREEDVSGVREEDVSGVKEEDKSGVREEDKSGVREEDVSGVREEDVSGVREEVSKTREED